MSKKENRANLAREYGHIFRCPLCKTPMKVDASKSLICENNHTFDFAKQGYVNMMTRPTKSQYSKELFTARHDIITESHLYGPLHRRISEVLSERLKSVQGSMLVLDAGCGEGSHLQKIIGECNGEEMVGVGLDIAKEGILLAAKNYEKSLWLVGDLANSPLADQSCHVALNILSPANYIDFKRVLVSEGLLIKVLPRSNYLKEVREAFFDEEDKRVYENSETVSLFKQHFHLVDDFNISYTVELNQTELRNLVRMTPLGWNAEEDRLSEFIAQGPLAVTVDLDVLVGEQKLISTL